jgi:hypothetical protein
MYTEHVGQQLLRVWLERTGEELTARQFFDGHIFPIFFDHPKMLQWVANSPFAQQIPAAERQKGQTERDYQLVRLHEMAASTTTRPADASFAVGFPASGVTATTSGQVWERGPWADAEAVYRSWLGAALGIGVAGGLSLLLTDSDVLWALCQGWTHYRTFLDQHSHVKGNQVESWNGHWLAHVLSTNYNPVDPLHKFDFAFILITRDKSAAIQPHPWVPLLFRLASHLSNRQITAYIYALGKTNRTVGFIPLLLDEIRTFRQLYCDFFEPAGDIAGGGGQSYETHLGLAAACEIGSIGLVALEPVRLDEKDLLKPVKTPEIVKQQKVHEIWLAAMLRQDCIPEQFMLQAVSHLASVLMRYATHKHEQREWRAITRYEQLVGHVFSQSVPAFTHKLLELLEATPAADEFREEFKNAVALVRGYPHKRFIRFISLLRLQYTIYTTT